MKRTAIVMAAGLALVALSLWLLRGGAEPAIQAREAYQRGDYASAVREYQKAAPECPDLGAVAANQGAALYRLDRYGDAEGRYRLADSGGADVRAARAAYDRGNCVLRDACQGDGAPDSARLEQAAQHYRACLAREPEIADGGDLFADARHNLELTKLLRNPTPAGEGADNTGQNDDRASDRPPAVGEKTEANDRAEDRADAQPSADASPDGRRTTATLASFVARCEDDEYLCPDCRRELEQAGLIPRQSDNKPNGSQARDGSENSTKEGPANGPPARSDLQDTESASKGNQADRQPRDAKQAAAQKENQKPKEGERDKQFAAAEDQSGEWREPPKQKQSKGPT
jgi:hypothetical protein